MYRSTLRNQSNARGTTERERERDDVIGRKRETNSSGRKQ